MTLEELKTEIGKLKESTAWAQMQIGILDAQICAMQKQQPEQPKLERWKPEHGEFAYTVGSYEVCKYKLGFNTEQGNQWQSYNCFQTEAEAKKEALRTRARRKLEWLARELNKGKGQLGIYHYITEINEIGNSTKGSLSVTSVYFKEYKDAEYALSQMTSEELEALR